MDKNERETNTRIRKERKGDGNRLVWTDGSEEFVRLGKGRSQGVHSTKETSEYGGTRRRRSTVGFTMKKSFLTSSKEDNEKE